MALRSNPANGGLVWRPVRALLHACVAASMIGIMALTSVNVATRYLLDAPISGSDEIVQYLLAILVFSAFPLVTIERRHFSVAIFSRSARGALRYWSVLLELVVSATACGIITVQLWSVAEQMRAERITTMVLQLPQAPLEFATSGLSSIAFAGLLAALARHVLLGGDQP